MSKNSPIISILKAISWRIIGSLDTVLISYFITQNTVVALSIGGVEVVTKSFLFYVHDRIWLRLITKIDNKKKITSDSFSKTTNVFALEKWEIDRKQKEKKLNQRGKTIWMTGLSGSGKTTLTNQLEKKLFLENYTCVVLDGDVLREGMNKGLGFSEQERYENIRRTAEIAKINTQNGIISIVALISPLQKMRNLAKEIIGKEDFIEVYISTSIEECENRDVKGLYAKARQGKIENLTGIQSIYEPPIIPDIVINTESITIENCTQTIYGHIKEKIRYCETTNKVISN